MAKEMVSIETGPYILYLNQIKNVEINSGTSKNELNKIAENLKENKLNSVFPIVCLSDNKEDFILLTGLPIYEAAKSAKLEAIWVFLVATQQAEASRWVEQNQMLSKLNEAVVGLQDVTDFLDFINDSHSNLFSVKGITPKDVKKIIDFRPYESLEDLQKKLGRKKVLNWIRAFKQK